MQKIALAAIATLCATASAIKSDDKVLDILTVKEVKGNWSVNSVLCGDVLDLPMSAWSYKNNEATTRELLFTYIGDSSDAPPNPEITFTPIWYTAGDTFKCIYYNVID